MTSPSPTGTERTLTRQSQELLDRIHEWARTADINATWSLGPMQAFVMIDEIKLVLESSPTPPAAAQGLRREAVMAAELRACAAQFDYYASQHLAKSPPDTIKAEVNLHWVKRCLNALQSLGPAAVTEEALGQWIYYHMYEGTGEPVGKIKADCLHDARALLRDFHIEEK